MVKLNLTPPGALILDADSVLGFVLHLSQLAHHLDRIRFACRLTDEERSKSQQPSLLHSFKGKSRTEHPDCPVA